MTNSTISEEWRRSSDLTIYEAAFWVTLEADPRQSAARQDNDDAYYTVFMNHPGGHDAVWKQCEAIVGAVRVGVIKATHEARDADGTLNFKGTYISLLDWLKWCRSHGLSELAERFAEGPPVDLVFDTPSIDDTHPPYLTTREITDCFMEFMGVDDPSKVLSEYPEWATRNGGLVLRGSRGRTNDSAWNPVQFALNLLDKNPRPTVAGKGPLKLDHLDAVFKLKLDQWEPIWRAKRPYR